MYKKQTRVTINLYSLNRKSKTPVEYTDTPDITKLGTIILNIPDTTLGNKRRVILKMTFGNTEILAEAIDKTSGNKVSTVIDFLSD